MATRLPTPPTRFPTIPSRFPTPPPTNRKETDFPTTFSPSPSLSGTGIELSCNDLEEVCLKNDDKGSCTNYLKRDECAVCDRNNRDAANICVVKTGSIHKRLGGYCRLCPKDPGTIRKCNEKKNKKQCKKLYKNCTKKKRTPGCILFLEINKCSLKKTKQTGIAFTKTPGYNNLCG